MDRGTWRVIVLGGIRSRIQLSMHMACGTRVCARAQTQRYTQKDFKKERSCASENYA